MLCTKTVCGLTRAAVELQLKRLTSHRRLRSSVTSSREATDGAPLPARSSGRSSRKENIAVDFEQTREAYRSKDSLELVRSLLVFKLCSYDFLVEKNQELIDLGKMVLGEKAFEQLMKMTFYGQFVAGEDHRAIKPLIQKNQAFGVGSVLDYSVEEDIVQTKPEQNNTDSYATAGKQSKGEDQEAESKAPKAGVYHYADEVKCDQHMETFIKCIKASGGTSMDGFSAIKMTALGRPQFLLQFSEILVKWQRFFSFLASQQATKNKNASEQRLELSHMQEFLTKLGADGDFYGWFTAKNPDSSGYIDMLDWNGLIDDRANASGLLVIPNVELGKLEPLLQSFTAEEEKQLQRILERLGILAKHALENNVRLMVDAEQTYLQPAISRLTLELQRIHNRDKAVVFNTYQCYLKEAFLNVSMDVELSKREGWRFAAKLVRGAYMYQERERAEQFGYEDPINPDYPSTNSMYHRCLDHVLDEIALNRKANVMVASHNEDTVKHTLKRMNELGLSPTENKVFFGQLLGMCDQISFPLAQAGFPVYKYVPYGPVNEVMPYLSRRAQENRGFMKGAQKERDLLWKELKRRLVSGELLHKPVY